MIEDERIQDYDEYRQFPPKKGCIIFFIIILILILCAFKILIE